MSNMEFNKIFAAILVAGIVAKMSGFAADKIVSPKQLSETAIFIDAPAEGAAAVEEGPQVPEPILAMLANADLERGERLYRACAACHAYEKGAGHRIGPNLWNIVGNDKAKHGDFAYSAALSGMDGAWGYEELNKFLWRPRDYVPGTSMNYVGLRRPDDRAAIIAWLRQKADSAKPLPSAAQIAAEQEAYNEITGAADSTDE